MAADLFETYAVTIVATMVLSSIFFHGDLNMMVYPLSIGGACILTSIIGTFFVKLGKSKNIKLGTFKPQGKNPEGQSQIKGKTFTYG